MTKRVKPYTEAGIKRLDCFRKDCTNKATQQWQICSDGPWRPICTDCDIELNKMVLKFMGFSNYEILIEEYKG